MRSMLVLWLLVTAASFPVAAQELLDRTLAIVGGQPITLSDTRAVIALGLIEPERTADPVRGVALQLVDRELILREVQRYAPAPPAESAVEVRLDEIRKRFTGAAALARVLEVHAFSEERLRTWLRDDLRTQAYLVQRFASASTPGDAEIAAAYARGKAEFDTQAMSFEQAVPIVRDRLSALRRRELIADWVADLRRRTDVVILQQ
jgi:hypothetical protein